MNPNDSWQDEERQLVDKLRKIEALFARPGTEGERVAAGHAADRIRRRIEQIARTERPFPHRFSLHDPWARMLFMALARRYGLQPYRNFGQHRTTVMLMVTHSVLERLLWPEFTALERTLRKHLNSVTRRIIAEAIHADVRDAETRPAHGDPSLRGELGVEGGGAQAST